MYRIYLALIYFSLCWNHLTILAQTQSFLERFEKMNPFPVQTHIPPYPVQLPGGGHLQGVQYVEFSGNPKIYLSGSSNTVAYLMDYTPNVPNSPVSFYTLFPKPLKHAGGIQTWKNYLIVGIEDNRARDTSVVMIYDLQGENSKLTPLITISRSGSFERATAGASAMEIWDYQHIVVVANWDSRDLDFYRSNGKALNDPDCSFTYWKSWNKALADISAWIDPFFRSYQNINLIPTVDGRLLMIGFAREGEQHFADIYRIDTGENTASQKMLSKIYTREFFPDQTSFSAGAGIYVDDRSMKIYSCDYHRGIVEVFE